jgi:hypothetical protein
MSPFGVHNPFHFNHSTSHYALPNAHLPIEIDPHHHHSNALPTGRPSLHDILSSTSAAHACGPYSADAFSAYLNKNYCPEILHFTRDVRAYQALYKVCAVEDRCVPELAEAWRRIVDGYIKEGAELEVNIGGEVREEILSAHWAFEQACGCGSEVAPPQPHVLERAYGLVFELMGGVWVQFLESAMGQQRHGEWKGSYGEADTDSTHSSTGDDHWDVAKMVHSARPFYRRASDLWGKARVWRDVKSRTVGKQLVAVKEEEWCR